MLAALCWIPGSACKSIPARYEPTEEELKEARELTEDGQLEEAQENLSENESMEEEEEEEEEENQRKKQKNKIRGIDQKLHQQAFEEFNMATYDDDEVDPDSVFGGTASSLMYHQENEEDLYLNMEDADLSDMEDLTIHPTDAVIIAAHSEDDISHLDMYIYEEKEENLYVHHDIMLPTFPLSIAWLDYHPKKEGNNGNLVAIGTFQPEIEIWDMDVLDNLEPTAVLGGKTEGTSLIQRARDAKKKTKKESKYLPGSHKGAVLTLDWNKFARYILASGSADHTIKVWDISKNSCIETFKHHKDKVQALKWHPIEPAIILTASYDKTVTVFDPRAPNSLNSWEIPADAEAVEWNVHSPNYFFASSENGQITCFDVRENGKPPVWTLDAHSKPTSCMHVNPAFPLLASGSVDKNWKLWDIKDNKPSCIYAEEIALPIFTLQFYGPSPYLLALGGQSKSETSESEERLKIINLKNNSSTQNYFSTQK